MEAATKQFRKRNAILNCLHSSDAHPSAETVYAMLKTEMPDISLATVYRNLALFKQQGKIISLGNINGVERFDGNTHPHVHFICSCCGSVLDLRDIQIPDQLCRAAAAESGAWVEECRLTFTGVCSQCAGEQSHSL